MSAPPSVGERGSFFTAPRAVALVALATLLAYLPALRAGFIWDDEFLIQHNRWLVAPGAVARALTHAFWDVESVAPGEATYYRPAVTLLFVALRAVFGLNPLAFHATVVLLHLGAVLLVGRLLTRALGNDPLAVGAGTALFALHATRAESVIWIVGVTDVLAALPVLCALTLALPPPDDPGLRAQPARPALVALCTALALLAKETALGLPVAVAALAYAARPAGASRRRDVLTLAGGSLAVALAYVALRTAWLPLPHAPASPPPATHAALVLETVGWYARMLAWPWPLSIIRAPVQVHDGAQVISPGYALAGLAVALAAVALYARRRDTMVGAGLAIAAAFLLPVLNVRWLGLMWLAAERYLYLPSVGLALALGAAVASVRARSGARRAVLAAGAVFAVANAVSIVARAGDFRDPGTFWAMEARFHPDVPVVQVGLAHAALDDGHPGRAFVHLRRALAESVRYEAGPRIGQDLLRAFDAALLVVPDDDRASLESAAGFFRALQDPNVPVARAVVLGRPFEYRKRVFGPVPPEALPALRSTEATVLSRLGQREQARAAALDALGRCRAQCTSVALNAALVCARARDWACALGANARAAVDAEDRAIVARQRTQLEAARAHAEDSARAGSEQERALGAAEVDLFLAQPEAARAELLRAGESVRAELLRVRVELLEYHFGEADERIARLRAGAPASAQRVFAELGALEARQRARVEGL